MLDRHVPAIVNVLAIFAVFIHGGQMGSIIVLIIAIEFFNDFNKYLILKNLNKIK